MKIVRPFTALLLFCRAALVLPFLLLPPTLEAAALVESTGLEIKEILAGEEAAAEGEAGLARKRLRAFYKKRDYLPAWHDELGPTSQAYDLLEAVNRADGDGLRPEFYRWAEIEAALAEESEAFEGGSPPEPAALALSDLMFTEAFFTFAFDLMAGHSNPSTFEGEWADTLWDADLPKLLRVALEEDIVAEALRGAAPPHPGYHRLRDALAQYREMAESGGWPRVPEGPRMAAGDTGRRVVLLKKRLAATGDLPPGMAGGDAFDPALEQAVARYQERHGLKADGIVGPRTLASLDVPAEARIRQIELNMERWRWLPEDLGRKHIVVNIAGFELGVFDGGAEVMQMRIVVGKPYWHTPSFSARMTEVVLNPSWNVPKGIFAREALPGIVSDPKYLKKEGLKVVKGRGAGARTVDPRGVDWSAVSAEDPDIRLVQPPGPRNPLGRLKFLLPNRFAVYLHDTPSRGLFELERRAFSHGCIRVEKPLELAAYLLSGGTEWTESRLLEEIGQGTTESIKLAERVPVHVLYMTSWVDAGGTLNFRDDVYGRDERLGEAMSGE